MVKTPRKTRNSSTSNSNVITPIADATAGTEKSNIISSTTNNNNNHCTNTGNQFTKGFIPPPTKSSFRSLSQKANSYNIVVDLTSTVLINNNHSTSHTDPSAGTTGNKNSNGSTKRSRSTSATANTSTKKFAVPKTPPKRYTNGKAKENSPLQEGKSVATPAAIVSNPNMSNSLANQTLLNTPFATTNNLTHHSASKLAPAAGQPANNAFNTADKMDSIMNSNASNIHTLVPPPPSSTYEVWRTRMKKLVFFFDSIDPKKEAELISQVKKAGSTCRFFLDKNVTHMVTGVSDESCTSTKKKVLTSVSSSSRYPNTNHAVAEKLMIKIWHVSKLETILKFVVGQYIPTLRGLAQAYEKERMFGLPTNKGLEQTLTYNPFKGQYLLIQDNSGNYKPLIVKEYLLKADGTEPFIPKIHTRTKCPFMLAPDTSTSEYFQHNQENDPNVELPMEVESKESQELEEDDIETDQEEEPCATMEDKVSNSNKPISTASGLISGSVTTLMRREPTKSGAMEKIEQRTITSKKGGATSTSENFITPQTKSVTAASKSTHLATASKPAAKSTTIRKQDNGLSFYYKAGFCENCGVEYAKFCEHVATKQHSMWAKNLVNFSSIDRFIDQVNSRVHKSFNRWYNVEDEVSSYEIIEEKESVVSDTDDSQVNEKENNIEKTTNICDESQEIKENDVDKMEKNDEIVLNNIMEDKYIQVDDPESEFCCGLCEKTNCEHVKSYLSDIKALMKKVSGMGYLAAALRCIRSIDLDDPDIDKYCKQDYSFMISRVSMHQAKGSSLGTLYTKEMLNRRCGIRAGSAVSETDESEDIEPMNNPTDNDSNRLQVKEYTRLVQENEEIEKLEQQEPKLETNSAGTMMDEDHCVESVQLLDTQATAEKHNEDVKQKESIIGAPTLVMVHDPLNPFEVDSVPVKDEKNNKYMEKGDNKGDQAAPASDEEIDPVPKEKKEEKPVFATPGMKTRSGKRKDRDDSSIFATAEPKTKRFTRSSQVGTPLLRSNKSDKKSATHSSINSDLELSNRRRSVRLFLMN